MGLNATNLNQAFVSSFSFTSSSVRIVDEGQPSSFIWISETCCLPVVASFPSQDYFGLDPDLCRPGSSHRVAVVEMLWLLSLQSGPHQSCSCFLALSFCSCAKCSSLNKIFPCEGGSSFGMCSFCWTHQTCSAGVLVNWNVLPKHPFQLWTSFCLWH